MLTLNAQKCLFSIFLHISMEHWPYRDDSVKCNAVMIVLGAYPTCGRKRDSVSLESQKQHQASESDLNLSEKAIRQELLLRKLARAIYRECFQP